MKTVAVAILSSLVVVWGADDVLASIEPVIESLGFDAAYGEMPIAEKLSYLPECQTATGVSAPPGEDAEVLPVVEVLVAFDRGAQAYVADKGVTLAEFAETQIAKMNAALATNRLDRFYSYGLAGVCKVDATYATIEAVTSKLVSGEGPLVSLRAARELYGADTVALLANTSGATLGDSIPLSGTSDVASRHESAFSVCSIRAVDTGKQHTLLHETAHNMGCGHARAQSVVNSPFEYGRGYYFKDGDVMRHTIMAYGGDDDASWYFSTSSDAFGFKLGDETNDNARVLRETCGEVAKWREGAAIGFAGAEVEGAVLQTSRRFPWFAEGDALRSFRQTNYLHQSTMPLKATVTGPKVLSFKHRSYFGGKSVAGSTYSHFDVLLDDSPVIAQTESTNSWSSAQVEIPEGTHEIVFVFSQRFAMNNPGDYKDGTPEMDDAVWIKDLALAAVDETVLDIPAGTTYALADVGPSVSAIVGAGTLACGSVLPDPAYGFTNATWQGTVAFADLAETDDATKDFRFERYGNAHSTIRLSRCALPYLKNNNATFAGTLELVADGGGQAAFSTKDGYSDAYNVFGVLAGDGSMVFTGKPKQGYVFNVATNYTGSISVEHGYYGSDPQGRRIVFGTVAQAADLPSQSATIAVQPRAAASIGASARWYAYHGIEIAGTLRVKGPGAKFDCDASAATGLEFVDGATLLFETANAALSLEKELRFADGIVKIAFAEGVTPAEGATLIAWPTTATAPDGVFAFASVSDATRWVLEKTGAGLIVRRGSFAVPGASAALEPGAALTAWLLDAGFTGADGTPWCAFVSRTGANGYANWKNFILGYPADDPAAKFEARLEIRNGQVVIETTEGDFPAGCNIVKRLFKKEKLDDPWPSAGEEMTGRRATVGEAAGSGFYKVNVSLESK